MLQTVLPIIYVILGVMTFIGLIALTYIKSPPDKAKVISGLKKEARYLIGKAGIRIPFLERIDELDLSIFQMDIRTTNTPTKEFINVNIDAVANVKISKESALIQKAAQHFLNMKTKDIAINVKQVLEGNMREIIGQMSLVALVNDKQEFSKKIQDNVKEDMEKLGLEIISFNVQNVTDDQEAIKNLGIDNLVSIKKTAEIARANSEREIAVAKSIAAEEANKAQVDANTKIAEQNKDLLIKQAEYKQEADTKQAYADAAYEIQKNIQLREVNQTEVKAATMKAEQELELREKEVALREQILNADVRKKAEAEKYEAEQVAEAQANVMKVIAQGKKEAATLEAEAIKAKGKSEADVVALRGQAEADAKKAILLAEAEALKVKLLAEAEGVKQKGLAEAEALDKKAEAMLKMKDAAVIEMVMKVLPEIAKEVSTPLGNIKELTMYGDQTTKLVESGTQNIDKILKVAKDALGLDLQSIINNFVDNSKTE